MADTELLRVAGLTPDAVWGSTPTQRQGKRGYVPLNRTLTARVVAATLPFLSKPPPAPIKVAERPTPLEVNCSGPLWAGRRATPAYVIDVFMFAWQLDLLEVRFFELEHVVDAFVVWEGMYGQRGIEKPLILPSNLHRFRRFRHKLHYIVQDDLDFREMLAAQRADGKLGKAWSEALARGTLKHRSVPGQDWVNEDHRLESARRWQRANKAAHRLPQQEQIFLFSDLDELPRAEAVLALKQCVPREGAFPRAKAAVPGSTIPAPLRLPMATYLLNMEHTEQKGKGPNYSIHVLDAPGKQGLRYSNYPKAPVEIGLGAHLSRCVTPAGLFLKAWLQAESSEWRAETERLTSLDLLAWYEKVRRNRLRTHGRPASLAAHSYVPWLIEHNKERFPYLWPSLFPDALAHYTSL